MNYINIKKKAIASIFSGIMIFIISLVFMGIIVFFLVNYFGSLEDLQNYKNNKNTLTAINEILNNLKTSEKGSYKKIFVDTTNIISFNETTNNITIEQEIKNQRFYEKQKNNISFGNLNIYKKESMFIYDLELNNNIDLNNSIEIMPGKQTIEFIISSKENNIPKINVKRIN